MITHTGYYSDVAVLADGSFVACWLEPGGPDIGAAKAEFLYVQRFDADGTATTAPLLVSSEYNGYTLAIDPLPNGGYVVSFRMTDGGGDGVEDRGYVWYEFDASNTVISGPHIVDPDDSGYDLWSYGNDGLVEVNGYVVSASHYGNGAWNVGLDVIDGAGTKVFEGDVATTESGAQFVPEVIGLADGKNALIVWSDNSGALDTEGFGVYARIFSTDTMGFVTTPFLVNQDMSGDEVGMGGSLEADTYALTALQGGGFSVFWFDSASGDIQGRFFGGESSNFAPTTAEFVANTTTDGAQHWVDSTLMPNGNVAIVYSSDGADGTTTIFAKEFTPSGAVYADEFVVATTTETITRPRVSAISDTQLAVTWQDPYVPLDSASNIVITTVDIPDITVIRGTRDPDILLGTARNEIILGLAGADALVGNGGDDLLNGGGGADLMQGGAGNDRYVVNTVKDVVIESAGEGTDTILTTVDNYSLESLGNVENLIYVGSGIFLGAGNSTDNIIRGGWSNDTIRGGAGNDVLRGIDGNDSLYGEGDDDTLIGGAGMDVLDGGAGSDTLMGNKGVDILIGGSGPDYLYGGAGHDIFLFVDAGDSLAGAASDTIGDFRSGQDVIDVSEVDADTTTAGDQAFSFLGSAAFSNRAGELRFSAGSVQGDIDGDGIADFQIVMAGVPAMSATDFVL